MERIWILVFLCCTLLVACQADENTQIDEPQSFVKQVREEYELFALENIETIEVSNSGEIKNLARFYLFLENVENNQPDTIQVIHFTTEGDPIRHLAQFHDGEIMLVIDNSRDKYGSGKIQQSKCRKIEVQESTERIDYLLKECEGQNENDILVVWK